MLWSGPVIPSEEVLGATISSWLTFLTFLPAVSLKTCFFSRSRHQPQSMGGPLNSYSNGGGSHADVYLCLEYFGIFFVFKLFRYV